MSILGYVSNWTQRMQGQRDLLPVPAWYINTLSGYAAISCQPYLTKQQTLTSTVTSLSHDRCLQKNSPNLATLPPGPVNVSATVLPASTLLPDTCPFLAEADEDDEEATLV